MQPQPPKRALRFLRWFCRDDFLEEIEGDLVEIFDRTVEESSLKRARRRFLLQTLWHFRPDFIRAFNFFPSFIDWAMYRNYLLVAWRNMQRQKLFASINIGGLAIGLACFMLIFRFVQQEVSYDTFFPNTDQIYRVYQTQPGNTYLGSNKFGVTPVALAAAMEETYPEVDKAMNIRQQKPLMQVGENSFLADGYMASEAFFEVLPFQLFEGNAAQVLREPQTIVLTQSLARKLFPRKSAIGQSVILQNDETYTVSGIAYDPPVNSTLQFAFIASILSDEYYQRDAQASLWRNSSINTIFTLHPDADPRKLESKLQGLVAEHREEDEKSPTFHIQALSELHFENGVILDIGEKGDRQFVTVIGVIALLVLLLACINYMNLAIARSIRRAREVGMRKAVGAGKKELLTQFMAESIFTVFLALLAAIGLAYAGTPLFSYLFDRPLTIEWEQSLWMIPALFGLMLLVSVVSGLFPALLISRVEVNQVLKGGKIAHLSKGGLQKILVIGQFATSTALIISCLVMYAQFQYMQNKELGFQTDQVLAIKADWRDSELADNFPSLRQQWQQNPGIQEIANSNHLPTYIDNSTVIKYGDSLAGIKELQVYHTQVDYTFLDVYDIELLAGRNFAPEYATDPESAYLLNETAVKGLGLTAETAVGQSVTYGDEGTIIGVIRDFHLHDMRLEINPLVLKLGTGFMGSISLRISPENLDQTLAYLEETFEANASYPFSYVFMDDEFAAMYAADKRMGQLLGVFTGLALIIAALGLFGLAAITITYRTKEIGIRKVLGGSTGEILRLLGSDYVKMVAISLVLAVPLAWYIMDQWLEEFAYKITLHSGFFIVAGAVTLLIAALAVGGQTLRAAVADPVEALRHE